MKAILLFILAVSVFSTETGLTLAEADKLAEIKETRWGGIIVEMAELHALAKGPLEDLVKGIHNIVVDLKK